MLASLLAIPIIVLGIYGAYDLMTDMDICECPEQTTQMFHRDHRR